MGITDGGRIGIEDEWRTERQHQLPFTHDAGIWSLLSHTNTSACSRTCAELGPGTLPLLPLNGINQQLMPIARDHAFSSRWIPSRLSSSLCAHPSSNVVEPAAEVTSFHGSGMSG